MVNKQGQTRLASYYEWFPIQERAALEAEVRPEQIQRMKLFSRRPFMFLFEKTFIIDYSPLLESYRIPMLFHIISRL